MKKLLNELIQMTDGALKGYLLPQKGHPARIYKAMQYSIFAGGKRLRPVLCLMAAKACGLSYKDALPAACALEMIHTYSLIHDDLPAMDNDDLRRGKPTCHKKFDEATAILAGDALLTKAFETALSASENKKTSKTALRAALEIAKGAGAEGMVGGQMADIENEGKKHTKKALLYIHGHKTGSLITAAVTAGAILAGADTKKEKLFRAFGEKIGLAFQIADDILDETGDEKKMGKKLRKDSGAGKLTWPAVFGLDESRKKAFKLLFEARQILGKIGTGTKGLSALAELFVNRTH
ncbi:MAG: polyprenyl synthetase [Candidatus Goldiibacteriota bacterium HGW-Goldbacteria-1]|jgi:geranylgeranyl diphosphate synthase type II|nr:MAG: polyprenyl synthetase [Candidatus Goldiibacteriota bacterium HGW-Goldbacteria-1]